MKLLGLDTGTRTRTVLSLVTAVTDALAVFGIIKFSDAQLESIKNLALVIASAIVWVMGFWYNENFTPEMTEATGEARLKKNAKGDIEGTGGATVESDFDEEL